MLWLTELKVKRLIDKKEKEIKKEYLKKTQYVIANYYVLSGKVRMKRGLVKTGRMLRSVRLEKDEIKAVEYALYVNKRTGFTNYVLQY